MLREETINFIKSLDHDDLSCFLRVYESATRPTDKEQYNRLREEVLTKLATDEQEQQLWDSPATKITGEPNDNA